MERAKLIAAMHVQACRAAGQMVAISGMQKVGTTVSYTLSPIRHNGHPDIGGSSVDAARKWGVIADASEGLGVTWGGMDNPQLFTVVGDAPKEQAPEPKAKKGGK